MKIVHVLLDAGHGGMINKVYQTAGKRSPKWTDLPQLFEGVQNREIVALIKSKLTAANIRFTDVVDSQNDISLKARVAKANSIYAKDKSAIYISIHADAAGNGNEDYPATGISVFTSPGQTKSDMLAQETFKALDVKLGNSTKKRTDSTDGDSDKEADFYVLTATTCPSILCELGFMTNRKECELMQTAKWKEDCAQAIFEGILNYSQKL
jgi:N-acetylmuramoyl-L-alanine amidase